jgi:hypothetical protein
MTSDRTASARRRHVRELLSAIDRAAAAIRAAQRARDALGKLAPEAMSLRVHRDDTDAPEGEPEQ